MQHKPSVSADCQHCPHLTWLQFCAVFHQSTSDIISTCTRGSRIHILCFFRFQKKLFRKAICDIKTSKISCFYKFTMTDRGSSKADWRCTGWLRVRMQLLMSTHHHLRHRRITNAYVLSTFVCFNNAWVLQQQWCATRLMLQAVIVVQVIQLLHSTTHTHTPVNGPLSRTTQVGRY